jgi:hypothetical protein
MTHADVGTVGAYRAARVPVAARFLQACPNQHTAYVTLLPADMPITKKIRQTTRNRKNKNLAIPAAAAAIPVNPKSAATQRDYKKNQGLTQHAFTSKKTIAFAYRCACSLF